MIQFTKIKLYTCKSIFNEEHCKGNFQKNYKTKHIKPFYRTERY